MLDNNNNKGSKMSKYDEEGNEVDPEEEGDDDKPSRIKDKREMDKILL